MTIQNATIWYSITIRKWSLSPLTGKTDFSILMGGRELVGFARWLQLKFHLNLLFIECNGNVTKNEMKRNETKEEIKKELTSSGIT